MCPLALTARPDPDARDRKVAALLFFLTCCSVTVVHYLTWQQGRGFDGALRSVQFTAALMAILLAHELGHVLVAARHRMVLAMPWFLPAPLWFGTFGAIIRRGDTPPTRTALLEMAAAGPLSGLAVVVVFAWVSIVGADPGIGELPPTVLSRPSLWWLISTLTHGGPPPRIHPDDPIGFAAGIGAWVTAMNLIPIGQLDGGHITTALAPRAARAVGWVATGLLLAAGWMWAGWAVWAFVAQIVASGSVTPRSDAPPSARARRIAVLAGVAFLLCVTLVPLDLAGSLPLASPAP